MPSKKKEEDTIWVTARLPIQMVKELDDFAEVTFNKRSSIIRQCLHLGMQTLRRENSGIDEELKKLQSRRRR